MGEPVANGHDKVVKPLRSDNYVLFFKKLQADCFDIIPGIQIRAVYSAKFGGESATGVSAWESWHPRIRMRDGYLRLSM